MAERSGFFNANNVDGSYDRQYDASDFTDYFSLFIGDGVFVNPANQLQVTAKSGLKVTVKAGAAFIEGCWYILTEDMDVDIPVNVTQYAVNTNVCVTLSRANREIKLRVRPAVSSMLPVNNGNEHDLVLASIAVGVGASQIIDANITDRRPNKTYCGYVTGLVDQIDTSNLFQQFTSEFNTWFDDIVAKLGDEPATSLQTQVDGLGDRMDAVETKAETNRTGLATTNSNIGSLSSLTTSVKTSIVNAINSLKSVVDGKLNSNMVVNNLSTTASGMALDARQGKTLYDMIGGALSGLTTGTKTSIIAAINWLKGQHDTTRNNLNTLTSQLSRMNRILVDIVVIPVAYSVGDVPDTTHTLTGSAQSTYDVSGCTFVGIMSGVYYGTQEDLPQITLSGTRNLSARVKCRRVGNNSETHTMNGDLIVFCYRAK